MQKYAKVKILFPKKLLDLRQLAFEQQLIYLCVTFYNISPIYYFSVIKSKK